MCIHEVVTFANEVSQRFLTELNDKVGWVCAERLVAATFIN